MASLLLHRLTESPLGSSVLPQSSKTSGKFGPTCPTACRCWRGSVSNHRWPIAPHGPCLKRVSWFVPRATASLENHWQLQMDRSGFATRPTAFSCLWCIPRRRSKCLRSSAGSASSKARWRAGRPQRSLMCLRPWWNRARPSPPYVSRSTLAGCWRQRTSCTIPWITQTLLPSSSRPRHPIQPLWDMSSMPMIWRTVTSFSRMMTLHVSRLPRDWVCAFLWLAVSRFVWQLPTTQKVPSAESGATLRAPWLRALSQLFCCTKSWPITPWADAWGQAIILMLDGDTSDRSAGHPCQFN